MNHKPGGADTAPVANQDSELRQGEETASGFEQDSSSSHALEGTVPTDPSRTPFEGKPPGVKDRSDSASAIDGHESHVAGEGNTSDLAHGSDFATFLAQMRQ
jgi:hypothetical protein